MTEDDARAYLVAAARLHHLTLSQEQAERLLVVFLRNVEIAQRVLDFPLPEDVEPAGVFRP
jgi:Protein of unknown function (DUF4089)